MTTLREEYEESLDNGEVLISFNKAIYDRHVVINSRSSYDSVIITAALMLAENPDEDMIPFLTDRIKGLSGFQFHSAKAVAKAILYQEENGEPILDGDGF